MKFYRQTRFGLAILDFLLGPDKDACCALLLYQTVICIKENMIIHFYSLYLIFVVVFAFCLLLVILQSTSIVPYLSPLRLHILQKKNL